MNQSDFKKFNFSLIGTESEVNGDMVFSGDTTLNCSVKGDITVKDKYELILERSSHIQGNIYCHNIEVFGHISGSIHASGKLSVRSSAVISGKIKSSKLSISPGATLNIEAHSEEKS